MRYLIGFSCALALIVTAMAGCSDGNAGSGSETYAWCQVDDPDGRQELAAVSFVDAEIGTVVGGIYRTTDAGRTWTVQESPTPMSRELDLVFTDANTGTIVGTLGTISRTTDGGAEWVAQDSGTQEDLHGVSFVDANAGMVVGDGGTILKTTDGGATWGALNSGTDAALRGVWLLDAMTATAVGAGGTILRTTDGGASWVPEDSGTAFTLNAVSFADVGTGIAVGDAGTMLRTTDGGATWMTQDIGTSFELNDVSFADATVGTVVGKQGTILRTTDGGATWTVEESDASYTNMDGIQGATFRGVSMADADNGVAVGGPFEYIVQRTTVSDDFGVCDPWCAKNLECYPDLVQGCNTDCLCDLRYHGLISAECEGALAAGIKCLTALTCEQIESFLFDNPDDHPCSAAQDRYEMACSS